MKQEVSTTFRALKIVCDWNLTEDEENNLDKSVAIVWDTNGFVGMYDPEVPDGGYFGENIDYDTWVKEDLPALKEANELFNETYF